MTNKIFLSTSTDNNVEVFFYVFRIDKNMDRQK